MIGIDITTISRFEKIDLKKLGRKLGKKIESPKHAAKVWACYESLTKAVGHSLDIKKLEFTFPPNQRPTVHDPYGILNGDYELSLAHEGDLLTAISIKI